jgi:cyclopropane-fatty-acyl-phospholipid synthase
MKAGTRVWSTHAPTPHATAFDRLMLAPLQRKLKEVSVRLVLWDGTSLYDSAEPPIATVQIRDRGMLMGLLRHRELAFGEGYSDGRLTVHGNLVALLEAIYRTCSPRAAGWLSRLSTWRRNTLKRSRDDIHQHYDLGNDFYRLWLDEEMIYSCAYFAEADMSLEEAQVAKMRHICQKLNLQPGERVIEAGCGWGSLALYMAEHHGVSVTAYNISREQIAYARQRARAAGLEDRVQFVEDDYRTISDRYDVFVSVGMLEHVGLAQFPVIGQVMDRALDPESGRGLLHFIGRNVAYPLNPWIRKQIFPGAYTPTLTQVTGRILEPFDLSILDVENLRPHYAMTLKHWRSRFDEASDRVLSMFDESFARAWRLYLAGSQAAFTTGWMQLFQVVFARGHHRDIPLARPRKAASVLSNQVNL